MCESHDEMVPIGDSNSSIGNDRSSALLPAEMEYIFVRLSIYRKFAKIKSDYTFKIAITNLYRNPEDPLSGSRPVLNL